MDSSRYAIVVAIYFGNGTGYEILKGRRYKTRAGVDRAYGRLEAQWDKSARQGTRHPSWEGKFGQHHKIVEIQPDESIREAVARLHEGAYYAGVGR